MRQSGLMRRIVRIATLIVALVASGRAVFPQKPSLEVCVRPNAGFWTWDEAGQSVGFEYDLLRGHAAESDGLVLNVRVSPSIDAMLADVEASRCDIGAGAVTITDARSERLDFSAPYFPALAVVIEPSGENRFGNRTARGLTIAVVRGTYHAELVTEFDGVVSLPVDSDQALFASLASGAAHAVVCDSALAVHYLAEDPELAVTGSLAEPSGFGFIFPKGSPLRAKVSAHLARLRDDGRYRLILARHFPSELVSALFDDDSAETN